PAGGLDRANVTDAVTFNLAAIGGPALAGALAATLGSATAVTVLALLAMAAVVATVLLGPVSTPAGDMSIGLLRTASTGLAHLVRTPPLRGATLASMLSIGGAGLLVVAFPARAAELGAPRASAGYLWAAAEIGCALS